MLFNEYLIEQMKITGLNKVEFCLQSGIKMENLIMIIQGYYIPTQKRTIKKISKALSLDFIKLLNYVVDCKTLRLTGKDGERL